MATKRNLLTERGEYHVHEVESLGNQKAVIDGRAVYVKNTGSPGMNVGIALAALGATFDIGLLAWPTLTYGFEELE